MAGSHSTPGGGGQGNLRERAENIGTTAGRKAGEGLERAQQTATTAAQRAQELASNVAEKAQDVASNVGQRAQEAASAVAEKAEGAISNAGERMSSWGESLRQGAPREGVLGQAATGVADTLQSGGRYLQDHGFSDIADDLGAVIRRYPIQAIACAFGVGIFLGMTSRR